MSRLLSFVSFFCLLLLCAGTAGPQPSEENLKAVSGGPGATAGEVGNVEAGVGVIRGRVVAAENGQPIAGANIAVRGLQVSTRSGAEGRFRLSGLPAGQHVILARAPGREPAREPVMLREGDTVRVSLPLPQGQQEQSLSQPNASSMDAVRAPGGRGAGGGQVVTRGRSENWNTEDYAPIESNEFRATSSHPLSTFSIDVDGASYANARRFIRNGERPPKDAVRIEEFLNYFSYDYPSPPAGAGTSSKDGHPFATTMEVGPNPWREKHRLIHVGIQGQKIPSTERPPTNLVFLVDVSGSMQSAKKLPLLKEGFRMLAEQLRPQDRVAMVVYAGSSGLVLESTPGSETDKIKQSIARLEAGGSTAGAAGLRQAYQIAERNRIEDGINRVLLATDGDFNVGVSSDGALQRLIEQKRETGTALTVLGFGTGNLKDNKMETLANHGNGNYYYVDSETEARRVLVGELGSTLQTIAKNVKIQVEFNPAEVAGYRLVGYVNRQLSSEEFADDSTDAGELGAGHSVTALYDVIPRGVESEVDVPTIGDLKYQKTRPTGAAASSGELLTLKLRYKEPGGDKSRLIERPLTRRVASGEVSTEFHFAAAVASYGMLLRGSEYRGDLGLEGIRQLARRGLGPNPSDARRGFLDLLDMHRDRLTAGAVPPGEASSD